MHFYIHKCNFCYAKDHQLQDVSSSRPPTEASPLDPTGGLSVPQPPVSGVQKFFKLNYATDKSMKCKLPPFTKCCKLG